jgi:hypothetical protein
MRASFFAGTRLERGNGLAAQPEHRPYVHRVDMVPLLVGHLLDESTAAHAGIVEQDVDAAEFFARGGNDAARRIVPGDVASQGGDGVVARMRILDRRFRSVHRQHPRALVGKQPGRSRANAGCGTGDDCNLSCQPGHVLLL